ncbi:MAG: PAS domain S-box protein [Rhizobacter sp.]|nr:PAS domain S-box protein [Bacteriovorax sp.]
MINKYIEDSHLDNVKSFLYAERTEKKIRDLLYAIDASSIVAFTDFNGKITYVNDKFCEISGYSREELIGQNHRIINSGFHPREFFTDLWTTIKSGKIWKGEIKNKAKDGSMYWVFTTIVPVLNERGRPREFLSIRYDVTEKKKLEEEHIRTQQEKMETKINQETSERFVTSLTHDMRTPLTIIRMSTQLIEKHLDDREAIHKLTETIFKNISRTDDMINDLLNATKIRAGHKIAVKMELCDACEIAGKTAEELSEIHGPRFILTSEAHGTGVWSSAGIKRIIENLCNNAIKYGDASSPINIKINVDESSLKIEVHNWGEIINPNDTQNLFEYLQRTASAQSSDKTGWGIGLTIVKGMAESHGGYVSVSSTKEAGTTFTVILPKKL